MSILKKLNSYSILIIITGVVTILTWVIPGGEYQYICQNNQQVLYVDEQPVCPISAQTGEDIAYANATDSEVDSRWYTHDYEYVYKQKEQTRLGIWQFINAPVNGFYAAIDIALFVIVIGGFLNLVIKTKAIDNGINQLLMKFDGDEIRLIPILMIIFALGGTTFGMAEETIGFYLLIIPVFLAAGFDALVGMRVLLLGSGVGVIASTINPFAIGAAIASSQMSLSIGTGIISRLVLLVIVCAIAIITTINYARKVKGDINQSDIIDIHEQIKSNLVGEQREFTELNRGQKQILFVFILTFIIMIMGVIPWNKFGINIFDDINNFLNTNLIVLSGSTGMVPLGNWWFGELTTLFFIAGIIVGWIATSHELISNITEIFLEGCKDLLGVALIIGVSRGITIIMNASGLDATLLYFGTQFLQNLSTIAFTLGSYIFYFPLSFLIPSTSGLAAAAMPVMAPLANQIGGINAVTYNITAFSVASGIVNLVTPTSGVVMGGLALAQIPYDRWVKHIMPTLLILVIVCGFFLASGVFLGFNI